MGSLIYDFGAVQTKRSLFPRSLSPKQKCERHEGPHIHIGNTKSYMLMSTGSDGKQELIFKSSPGTGCNSF